MFDLLKVATHKHRNLCRGDIDEFVAWKKSITQSP